MPKTPLPPNTKVLIMGREGQVASSLRRALKDLVHLEQTFFDQDYAGEGAHFLDVSDLKAIKPLIIKLKPDIIINATAYTAVDKAETENEQALVINAHAPEVMALAAREIGSLFIHYSTDYVFDGAGHTPFKEDHFCAPLNTYGASKRKGEQNIIAIPDLSYFIVRTSWVYGPDGQNFLKTMLRLAAEREELGVVDDQIGSPTSSDQIAAATLAILKQSYHDNQEWSKNLLGVYHFCADGFTSWHGFAEYIFSTARDLGAMLKIKKLNAIPTTAYPTPAKRPANSRLDTHKFTATFRYQPESWQIETERVLKELLKLTP